MKTIAHILISIMFIGLASCKEIRTVKVTATEENGTPIEGVDATITFMGYSGQQTQRVKGRTNLSGVFQASGSPELRMYAQLEKDGYYTTASDRLSRTQNHDLIYVLRKVRKPIPLYAKKIHLQLPKNKEWLGYDLKIGDWMAPHGGGKMSDFLVRCDTEMTGQMTAKGSFEIKFSENEGIQLEANNYQKYSRMKMPHLAPEKGYISMFFREEESHHDKSFRQDAGYFLRTRVTKKGDVIISSNYGKILTDIYLVLPQNLC